MTVHELYVWLAAHEAAVLALVGALPVGITLLSALLKAARRRDASQQVANVGIALGGGVLFIALLAVGYAIGVLGVNPLAEASAGLLLAPLYLVVAGFAGEHIVHPGEQQRIRSKLRFGLLSVVFLGLLAAVFSVLRIYMLVFTNMWGFLLFLVFVLGAFYVIVRKLI